jgi:hypothetical protein
MGEVKRTTAEIQNDIERIRENLTRDVVALESTVRDKLDWRRPIREAPVKSVAMAFGLGFLLAML